MAILGSAKEGSKHWLSQRVTAIALVFLVIWFLITILRISSGSIESLIEIIRSPFDLTMLGLLIGTSLYHGNLGIQVVIEDYIHCNSLKFILILAIRFISILSFLVCLTAIITFYFSAFNIGF